MRIFPFITAGRGHAHPQSVEDEAEAAPASFADTQSQRTTRLRCVTARRRPSRGAG